MLWQEFGANRRRGWDGLLRLDRGCKRNVARVKRDEAICAKDFCLAVILIMTIILDAGQISRNHGQIVTFLMTVI